MNFSLSLLAIIIVHLARNGSAGESTSTKVVKITTTKSQPKSTTSKTTTVGNHISDPLITRWVLFNGSYGYNNIKANVLSLTYGTNLVYVQTNSVPSYSIGPWPNDPNTPRALNKTYTFPRFATPNQGTKTSIPFGKIGVWINGFLIYSALDSMKQKVYIIEGGNLDSCNGLPDVRGVYHTFINPVCLYNSTDSSRHSPLLGFMFDAYPIYGPFGYSDAYNSSSSIKRMLPSYKLKNPRDKLNNYEYVIGLGDLDESNGRWCVTPDYPNGIYAYFVGTDSEGKPAYPYTSTTTHHHLARLNEILINFS